MSLWEYKVISSGKGGFATPALLEKFLNDLGRDEWEIIDFRTAPDNPLAFTGLARRSTQRDWTLEDAAAAAARAEADKLRSEFEAKFKAATTAGTPGAAAEPAAASFLQEKVAPDDGFRKPVDTSHDAEPEDEEEAKADEWDKMVAEDEELPTFFDAIRPLMRKNQRGPGMSVGIDYLAKKWDQTEDDLKAALLECGFAVPEDEDETPTYLEYDGDLYWVNVNRRGELWINTKEKPRQVFRTAKGQRVAPPEPEKKPESAPKPEGETKSEPAAEGADTAETTQQPAGDEASAKEAKPQKSGHALPQGTALLDKIRPHMRRNRRGPGGSGSASFLSRALKCGEADLKAAFSALGLSIPSSPNEKPVYTEIANELWWVNLDSRGGMWINGRHKKPGEKSGDAHQAADATSGAPTSEPSAPEQPAQEPSAATGESLPEDAGAESNEPPAAASAPSEAAAPEANQPAGEPSTVASLPSPAESPSSMPAGAPNGGSAEQGSVLASVRLLLKETKSGSIAAKVDRIGEQLGKSADEVVATLVSVGLKVPEKPREKPIFVEHAGEIFWLNRNAKGELWLNAKASKFSAKEEDGEAEEAEESGEEQSESADSAEGEGERKGARRTRGKKKE